MDIVLIAALDSNYGIGKKGGLPWKLPGDLNHFRELTMGHPIVMGRTTWESVNKPLTGRRTIVMSRNGAYRPSVPTDHIARTVEGVLKLARHHFCPRLYICGGTEVYGAFMEHATLMFLTRIHGIYDCDVHFPAYDVRAWIVINTASFVEDGIPYTHETLQRRAPIV